MDQELGRLFRDLEAKGELANTLILFSSDNGACPYDRRSLGQDHEPYKPDVTWSDSTGWAWARNSPFRYYKQNQFEGGIATPAIVHWPGGLKTRPGALDHSPRTSWMCCRPSPNWPARTFPSLIPAAN